MAGVPQNHPRKQARNKNLQLKPRNVFPFPLKTTLVRSHVEPFVLLEKNARSLSEGRDAELAARERSRHRDIFLTLFLSSAGILLA